MSKSNEGMDYALADICDETADNVESLVSHIDGLDAVDDTALEAEKMVREAFGDASLLLNDAIKERDDAYDSFSKIFESLEGLKEVLKAIESDMSDQSNEAYEALWNPIDAIEYEVVHRRR